VASAGGSPASRTTARAPATKAVGGACSACKSCIGGRCAQCLSLACANGSTNVSANPAKKVKAKHAVAAECTTTVLPDGRVVYG
jgi:hypothetical protein